MVVVDMKPGGGTPQHHTATRAFGANFESGVGVHCPGDLAPKRLRTPVNGAGCPRLRATGPFEPPWTPPAAAGANGAFPRAHAEFPQEPRAHARKPGGAVLAGPLYMRG